MELELLKSKAQNLLDEWRNDEAYRYLLEAALVFNDPDTLHLLACLNYYPSLKKDVDYKKAFRFFLLACKAGESDYGVLGSIMEDYQNSVKRNVDAQEGYRTLLKYLMGQNSSAAYIYAGDEYMDTNFVFDPDWRKGLDCYEKAVELGDPFGYECIAKAYYTGTAGGVNYQKAFEYYTKSEEFHSSEKYYYLGEMYFHGYYVQKDREKAKEYYEQLINDEVYSNTDDQYVSLARRRLLEMEE